MERPLHSKETHYCTLHYVFREKGLDWKAHHSSLVRSSTTSFSRAQLAKTSVGPSAEDPSTSLRSHPVTWRGRWEGEGGWGQVSGGGRGAGTGERWGAGEKEHGTGERVVTGERGSCDRQEGIM